jgi:4-amino-4-deoxy-L-arabinose transferase-like glycosyltransferase
MERQTFTWGSSGNNIRKTERWVERLWVLGLLLAALLLFCLDLGSLPLFDPGEGMVALVARKILSSPLNFWQWFYPMFDGKPFLESPPLLYVLIAGVYKIAGVNEWTTRLPGAVLSALSVPILYGIGREIFPSRLGAIFSSLVYLTLIPVACQGRLAIADGMALCFVVLMIWCVLRSRRDFRWCLGIGLSLSLISLSKGLILSSLAGAIAFLFLSWDTPRLLSSYYWWLGLFLGSVPGIAWYTVGILQYHLSFSPINLFNQSLQPLWNAIITRSRHPWYHLIELLKFATPWLIFFPYGLRLAWENRNWGWAKLVLVWTSVCGLAIVAMFTNMAMFTNYEYILPLSPALALASGALLTEVWYLPSCKSYPAAWKLGLALFAFLTIIPSFYFGIFDSLNRSLSIIFACVALTMAMAAVLLSRRDLQFILILFWGMYISLLLFMTSPYWTPKFAETYPVKPLAELIQRRIPNHQVIYASFDAARPALNFYSGRQVIPVSNPELKQKWDSAQLIYLLLDADTEAQLSLKSSRLIERLSRWSLVAKNTD